MRGPVPFTSVCPTPDGWAAESVNRTEVTYRQAYVQRQALELYTHLMRVPPSLVVTAP